ncbi:mevalonate kinase-like [Rhipicephalus microplus]|uniref:mevalonate kinase-like n=1 Tax=Rhipicephalus microplus TaxID=6941 RepID=UPI003F6B6E66
MASSATVTTITASAPGKTIIHGEHAVVYGKAAVAASVNLRTRVTCCDHDSFVVLEAPDLDFVEAWPVSKFEAFAVPERTYTATVIFSGTLVPDICSAFEIDAKSSKARDQGKLAFLFLVVGITLRHNNGRFGPLKFTINSRLPLGAGLGSSASYSTVLATVLLAKYGVVQRTLSSKDRELICSWAFQAECILHGQPSGIDNTICTYGGAVLFKGGKISESLESIPSYKVLLVNTRVPRNTKALVAGVKKRHDQFPDVIKPVLESIEAISETFWRLLKTAPDTAENMFCKSLELVQMNQSLLNCLGVGHPRLDRVAEIATQHGLAAKLTGAGGGGCALLLCRVGCQNSMGSSGGPELHAVCKQLEEEGFLYWEVDLGCPGVTLD